MRRAWLAFPVVGVLLLAGCGSEAPRQADARRAVQDALPAAEYDVARHVSALLAHGVEVDQVVCDSTGIAVGAAPVPVLDVSLAKANGLAHDPVKLAHTLADLLG